MISDRVQPWSAVAFRRFGVSDSRRRNGSTPGGDSELDQIQQMLPHDPVLAYAMHDRSNHMAVILYFKQGPRAQSYLRSFFADCRMLLHFLIFPSCFTKWCWTRFLPTPLQSMMVCLVCASTPVIKMCVLCSNLSKFIDESFCRSTQLAKKKWRYL